MLGFFRLRQLPGVESICETHYRRGGVAVTAVHETDCLRVEGALQPDTKDRLRRMFDLDADRETIARQIQMAPAFLPGAWCPFELAVRAVLGQQVSVAAARTLAGRLWSRCPLTPEALAGSSLAGLGILPARCRTLQALALAAQVAGFRYEREQLLAIPGIGPWTAEYIGMRARRDPDAFPAGDLILRRSAIPGAVLSERALLAYADRWRPYRAYAAIALWSRA